MWVFNWQIISPVGRLVEDDLVNLGIVQQVSDNILATDCSGGLVFMTEGILRLVEKALRARTFGAVVIRLIPYISIDKQRDGYGRSRLDLPDNNTD